MIGDLTDRIRRRLNRRLAYRACFLAPGGELTGHGRDVVSDLTRFCKPYKSSLIVSPVTRSVDPLAMAYAEGQRSVFLHVLAVLKLTEDDIIRAAEDEA